MFQSSLSVRYRAKLDSTKSTAWSLSWCIGSIRPHTLDFQHHVKTLLLRYVLRPIWNRKLIVSMPRPVIAHAHYCPYSDFLVRRLCIKQTQNAAPEVAALKWIRKHTTLPVPRPWLSFTYRAFEYIIMDRLPGAELEEVLEDCTKEQRQCYIDELAEMIAELRALKSPYGPKICLASGSCVNVKSGLGCRSLGPFKTEDDFNDAILDHMWPVEARTKYPRPHPSDLCHDITHPIVFAHGDLAPRNILVMNGHITAIVDWETAGWFPAYWEFVETYDSNDECRGECFLDLFRSWIPQIMPLYPRELSVRKRFGGF